MQKKLETISVSSIVDFQDDRLRWCYKWIENRVPRRVPQALVVGKIVHKAFENAFNNGTTVGAELALLLGPFEGSILDEREQKTYEELAGLVEPLTFWKDNFPVERVLEVEEPFQFFVTSGAKFRGRPDRVAIVFGKIMHIQNKTIGQSVDGGRYLTLARRNLHELIYGWYLAKKYEKTAEYGGTIYNVVRKLKHRELISKGKADKLVALGALRADYTNVDRRRLGDIMNPIETMFIQSVVGIDPMQQQQALEDVNDLSIEMDRTASHYLSGGNIPSVRTRDGGSHGNSIDLYTSVMLGEASLTDDALFMDREETYEDQEESNE